MALAYERFASPVEVRRPDGDLVFRDRCVLEPGAGLGRRGMLGGHAALGSLFVVRRGLSSNVLAEALRDLDVHAGCSELPQAPGSGCWPPDTERAAAAVTAAWRAARIALTGGASAAVPALLRDNPQRIRGLPWMPRG